MAAAPSGNAGLSSSNLATHEVIRRIAERIAGLCVVPGIWALGAPKSSRAVGNAVGANPVALWIPCHRVIQQSGALGGYRWGLDVKRKVQAWEAAQYAEQLESAHG
jgi:hypothetical protein